MFVCTASLSYKLEIINSPVGLVALTNGTNFTYTELNFFAYNVETDFSGYKISVGNTREEALTNASVAECLLTVNSTLNRPTKIQIGGSEAVGADCFISDLSVLGSGTWVGVTGFGSRDCEQYGENSGCSPYSETGVAEVLPYIAPPTELTLQVPSNYYMLSLSMDVIPANITGLGLFYSPNLDEAESRASEDGSIYDGFCPLTSSMITAGSPLRIQIGGTKVAGVDCYIDNFYLLQGDVIVVRNSVNRVKYPWSEPLSVTIP